MAKMLFAHLWVMGGSGCRSLRCLTYGILFVVCLAPFADAAERNPRDVQFGLSLGGHTGQFLNQARGVENSGLLGRVSIIQPLKKHEVRVDLALIYFTVLVPAAPRYAQIFDTEQTTVRYANPSFMYYFTERTQRYQLRFGLGGTAPIANLRDERIERSRADAYALEGASAMGGHRQLWLWMPKAFTAVGHLDAYARGSGGLIAGVGLDMAGAVRVATSESNGFSGLTSTPNDFDGIAQGVLELGYDTRAIRTSVSASYVMVPTKALSWDEKDQLAGMVSVRWRLKLVDVVSALSMPIDSPSGYLDDQYPLWSLNIGLASPTFKALVDVY